MKKLLLLLVAISTCMVAFAGRKNLPNGKVVYWSDQTQVIQYNSCRVEIRITGECDFNVWGEVKLGDQRKPFMIYAGETKANIDFDNLDNGRRYNISVTVKN